MTPCRRYLTLTLLVLLLMPLSLGWAGNRRLMSMMGAERDAQPDGGEMISGCCAYWKTAPIHRWAQRPRSK